MYVQLSDANWICGVAVAARRPYQFTSGLTNLRFAEIGLQFFRNCNGAVRLLARFDQGCEKPGQSQAGTIKRVGKAVLSFAVPISKIHSPRLEIFEIGAT